MSRLHKVYDKDGKFLGTIIGQTEKEALTVAKERNPKAAAVKPISAPIAGLKNVEQTQEADTVPGNAPAGVPVIKNDGQAVGIGTDDPEAAGEVVAETAAPEAASKKKK